MSSMFTGAIFSKSSGFERLDDALDVRSGRVPKPAARTVTRTLPCSAGSIDAPKMICRFGIDGATDHFRGFVHFIHREIEAAGDVEDHAARAFDRGLEQRRRDRFLRCVGCAMFARAFADAHHRRTGVGHDRFYVGEIEIDQSRLRNEIRDALNTLTQHVIRIRERFVERRAFLDDLQDALVRNRDDRIAFRFEIGDAALRRLHALAGLRMRTAS